MVVRIVLVAVHARTARRALCLFAAALPILLIGSRCAACTGDCDGDGRVAVNEVTHGLAIAFEKTSLSTCVSLDRDGSRSVTVDELLAAIKAVLHGCPATPTPSVTPTASITDTPTATPTINQPPRVATPSVYRTYPDFEILVPLATDPEGEAVACVGDQLPPGAVIDNDLLRWIPGPEQVGPYRIPFRCADAAEPPSSAAGELALKVLPLDPCSRPSCDPASGCTPAVPPPRERCCTDAVIPRIAEPAADCPGGRAVFVGRNLVGFGRLQNCDVMRVRNFAQSGAEITFHVEGRCFNTANYVEVAARIDTLDDDGTDRIVVNAISPVMITPSADGFALKRNIVFEVLGPGPFFFIEGAEANLTVTLTDNDGMSATERLRVRLTFDRVSDLPEADAPATPTATPS